jgi:hypothetical protein
LRQGWFCFLFLFFYFSTGRFCHPASTVVVEWEDEPSIIFPFFHIILHFFFKKKKSCDWVDNICLCLVKCLQGLILRNTPLPFSNQTMKICSTFFNPNKWKVLPSS